MPDYYATFFTDPDGVRLEVIAKTRKPMILRRSGARSAAFVDATAAAVVARKICVTAADFA